MSGQDLRLVVNTSPLIHLAEAGLLHLLKDAAPTVWVPEPVAREIRAYGIQDPTARALDAHDWADGSAGAGGFSLWSGRPSQRASPRPVVAAGIASLAAFRVRCRGPS